MEYNRKERNNVRVIRSNNTYIGSRESKRIRATELAVMLGWQYTDWQGISIKKLLTNTEKKNLAEGKITWRSLSIEEYKPIECCSKEAKTTAQVRMMI
ncbi:hypothetical protein RB195_001227 [Necator americanus]